jgi:hypothetical protein
VRRVKLLHDRDRAEGFGRVWLPSALREKYPGADRELGWQFLFPSGRRSADPRHVGPPDQAPRMRHHVHENMVQKQFRRAVLASGLTKRASCHTLRKASAYYTTFRRMVYFQANSCCPGFGFRGWRPSWIAFIVA